MIAKDEAFDAMLSILEAVVCFEENAAPGSFVSGCGHERDIAKLLRIHGIQVDEMVGSDKFRSRVREELTRAVKNVIQLARAAQCTSK